MDYLLGQPAESIRLGLPGGLSDQLRLDPADATIDNGNVVLPVASRSFSLVLGADPPWRRWPGAYPPAFSVEGRGTVVYIPYLLPAGCKDSSVVVRGDLAAVVDGEFRRIRREYQVVDLTGFVLIGDDLSSDSLFQMAKSLPGKLEEAIRTSYEDAQVGVTRVLGLARRDVPMLVDFSADGAPDEPRYGGDAAGEPCVIRLWFRGEAWQDESVELHAKMHDVLVHELVHCYQAEENWEPWAHEGHARFVEVLLAARPEGSYSPGSAVEARFVGDFDRCMNDLRAGDRRIQAYACGGVAYWLRWLETGEVDMLAKGSLEKGGAGSVAARFVDRSASEAEVVEFVLASGVELEIEKDVQETAAWVRSRLVMTLLRMTCGPRIGYWTNDSSITLDAQSCPDLHELEVVGIAGGHVIDDVHGIYPAVVAGCAEAGKVAVEGVDGGSRWLQCDSTHEWPSPVGSRYTLSAPFSRRDVRPEGARMADTVPCL